MILLRIVAVRHENHRFIRVMLDAPPVAVVPDLDFVLGGWWFRSAGYPPGAVFATWLDPRL